MTAVTVDFTTWFSVGSYGGLACCMFAIAANALYTSVRKRGTTRQLAGTIVTCVISALLLLPAIVWLNIRFASQQASLPLAEIEVALAYVALCGWLLPLGVTTTYWLFTLPRTTMNSAHVPRTRPSDRRAFTSPRASALQPPRYQPGMPVPFVYAEDTPWGWLEFRSGNFQGQRLALKPSIVTIGRDEDNEIWLDDDMASRHHAELAWDQGKIYITDRDSLNGVLLNTKRIRGSALVQNNDMLEIGTLRFLFVLAEQQELPNLSDPLAHHTWRSALETLEGDDANLPETAQLEPNSVPFGTLPPESSMSGMENQQPEEQFTPRPGPNTNPGQIHGPMPLKLPSRMPKEP